MERKWTWFDRKGIIENTKNLHHSKRIGIIYTNTKARALHVYITKLVQVNPLHPTACTQSTEDRK